MVTTLVALFALWGCGSDDSPEAVDRPGGEEPTGEWAEVVAAAEEEGVVVVYGAKGPPIPALIEEAFEEAYPEIDFQYIDLGSGEQVERVNQELDVGRLGADLLLNSEVLWHQELVEAGEVFGPDELGPSTELWEPQYYEGGVAQVNADPIGIMYNTDLVDEPPTDWDSLVDPAYRGRVGILDSSLATAQILYWDMLQTNLGDRFDAFLTGFGDLEPQIHGGSTSLSQSIAAGELAWAPFGNAYTTNPLKEQGAPVDLVFPESGTMMVQMNALAMRSGPHPNAARVLIDFLMSEAGQTAINGDQKGYSRIGVEGSLPFDAEKLMGIEARHTDPEVVREINDMFDGAFR